MNPETQKQINDLKRTIDDLKKLLEKSLKDVDNKIGGVKNTQTSHTHGDTDSSKQIYNSPVKLKPGSEVGVGMIAMAEAANFKNTADHAVGGIVVGQDGNINDGLNTTQLAIEFNKDNDTSNITSIASPIFVGTKGSIASGASVLYNEEYRFEVNALAGKYISITNVITGDVEGFLIVSNTDTDITISGTSGETFVRNAQFVIFTPVYLGFSTNPWRRLYIVEGTGGGVRFGLGNTSNGQNGLLYMSSGGDLFWRDKSGNSTQLN